GSKAGEGKTTYLLPVGKGALFADAKANLRYPASIPDGTSNTILIVDAADDRAVTWTKPDDLTYDAKDPLKGLAVRNGKEFLAGFADGAVHAISKSAAKTNLVAAFTPAEGDILNFGGDEDRLIGGGRPDIFDIPGVPREKIEQLKVQEFLTKGI